MEIKKGKKKIKLHGKSETAIVEVLFSNYTLFVFKGELSPNDILIKYTSGKGRLRTPKHIHWAVDILLKQQGNRELTKKFIECAQDFWKNCKPLKSNDFCTLKNVIASGVGKTGVFDPKQYSPLNNYGEYDVEFLFTLLKLLAIQERTNREDAYFFENVLDKLRQEKLDIFSVVSTASHSRKG